MCVIIQKPKDIVISNETFEECWEANPDGAGFMFALNDKIHIFKGFMSLDEFYSAYALHKHVKSDIIIHFRTATCGGTNKEQTHPFLVNSDLAFVHNGHILNDFANEDSDKSDTMVFNEFILSKLPPNFLDNSGIIYLLNGYLSNSTILLLDNKGKITKLGSTEQSIEQDGCWFSNSSWCRSYSRHFTNSRANLSDVDNCPFCGGVGKVDNDDVYWSIICEECGAEGPVCKRKDEALEKWNKRFEPSFVGSV